MPPEEWCHESQLQEGRMADGEAVSLRGLGFRVWGLGFRV